MENISENNFLETDLGNVSLNLRGEYVETTKYEYLDTVFYFGGSYVALKDVVDIAPKKNQNSDYWQCLSVAGDTTVEYLELAKQVSDNANTSSTKANEAVEAANSAFNSANNASTSASNASAKAAESLQSAESAGSYAKDVKKNADIVVSAKEVVVEKTDGFEKQVETAISDAKKAVENQKVVSVREAKEEIAPLVETEVKKQVDFQKDSITEVANNSLEELIVAKANSLKEVSDKGAEQLANVKEAAASYQNQIDELTDIANKQTVELKSLNENLELKVTQPYLNSGDISNSTIAYSDEGTVKNLKIYGNSVQATTAGKNLLDENTLIKGYIDSNNLTEIKGDTELFRTIKMYLTKGAYKLITPCTISRIRGFTNTYHSSGNDYTGITFNALPSGQAGPADQVGIVINVLEDDVVYVTFRKNDSTAYDIWAMLVKDDVTDLTYESHTGGIPSPNIDYPQAIVNINNPEINVYGNNLIDNSKFLFNNALDLNGNITYSPNTYTYTEYIFIKNIKNITLSGASLNSQYNNFTYYLYDSNKKLLYRKSTFKSNVIVDNSVYNAMYMRINFSSIELATIQAEIDQTASPYTPHHSQNIQLKYKDNTALELKSIETNRDFIQFGNDKVLLNKYVDSIILNGSETYALHTSNDTYISFMISDSNVSDKFSGLKKLLCDKLIWAAWDDALDKEMLWTSENSCGIAIEKSRLNNITVDEFKSWLVENNLTIYYQLDTPIIEEITDKLDSSCLEAINTYYPVTNVFSDATINFDYKVNLKSWLEIKDNEYIEYTTKNDNGLYSDSYWQRYFALQRTGKVYTVRFPKFETSSVPNGTKLDDNEYLIAIPSTDTITGRNDYENIPLFKTYDVNAAVDDNGKITVSAVKGDFLFKDTGKVDVFVLGMSYYEKYWDDDKYWYYSRTDSPREGYTIARECLSKDGLARSYALYGKYVCGSIDGILYSSKGLAPASSINSPSISYNTAVTEFHKKGKYYCAGALSTYKYIMTTLYLKYATLNSQSIINGCYSYNSQYQVVIAESNVKRVVLPTAQANNFIVGSCVSVGDKGTNTGIDRNSTYMHNIAKCVTVTRIETVDDTNSAVYVDVEVAFNTTATTYISTMPWKSGFSDLVKGQDGCPGDLLNGKYPMAVQGIELAVGGYEVPGNAIMDIPSVAVRDYYIINDASKLNTDVTTIKSSYNKSSYQAVATNLNNWNYITEMKVDVSNGAMFISKAGASGSGSATGFCDAMYFDANSSGQREFLLLGTLSSGAIAGVSYLYAYGLANADWHLLARLSILA